MRLRNVPTRLATGAFVLHSGIGKWSGGPEQAAGVHGMAAGAIPPLASVDPPVFLKVLSVSEVAIGALLLTPFVSNRRAGLALTAFAGGLLTMYARTPALHEPGSIWPTQQGTGIAKDAWMLGIGLGLLLDPAARRKTVVADRGVSGA